MIDLLRTLGIEKGEPFAPDARTIETLDAAAREASAVIDRHYESLFSPPFNEGIHWAVPVSKESLDGLPDSFADANRYPVLDRAAMYAINSPPDCSNWVPTGGRPFEVLVPLSASTMMKRLAYSIWPLPQSSPVILSARLTLWRSAST